MIQFFYFFYFQCLPLTWQDKVLTLVIGRLQDKSSQVRKNSVQLVTAFIKCNPFAAKVRGDHIDCRDSNTVIFY